MEGEEEEDGFKSDGSESFKVLSEGDEEQK